jgi:cytochrome oxidase Cu insertion factor (SCO1/SenC/PrrC family)
MMGASCEEGDRFMTKQHIRALLLFALLLGGCQRAAGPDAVTQQATPANTPAGGGAAAGQPPAPVTHLKAGDPAPDFALTDTEGQTVRLSDFRGKKNVVLAFYVLAFTGG